MTDARSSRSVVAQSCPNCGKLHDVGVYVSGQQVICTCGIRFDVKRSDVKTVGPKSEMSTLNAHPAAGEHGGLDKTFASSKPVPSQVEVPHLSTPFDDDEVTSVPTGAKVPGYELVELLGKGGMGEVWRARQTSLGRLVAVKLLPPRFAKDPEFVARFDKEAQALASLSHPGVVQIIDRGQAGDHYFFAMELVPGINLREMMASGRLPVKDAARIGTQIARAIDYAHEMKIVHRDLKPENILIDARGHVKIADFGLAGMKGNERDIALTATAVAMGTVNYMAPEQRRDAKNVDHRADLYSLGVLLYEMFTGEVPMGRFKLPSVKVPGLDPRLDEIIGALLETEPEARPSRANLVAEALEQAVPQSGGPTPATALPPTASLSPQSKAASFIQGPAAGWKAGVFVLGALLLFAVVLKVWPPASATPLPSSAPAWYHDSDDEELFSSIATDGGSFTLGFEPVADGEQLNLHSGMWTVEAGSLSAVQYGGPMQHDVLVPRAYVAKRYYLADRFEAAVDVEIEPLPAEFPPVDLQSVQHFAELAFRINDLQVSVFAIPGTDMRIGWRYFGKDGRQEDGNSVVDVQQLQADPVRVPTGKFRLRLKLTAMKNGDVNAEAFMNGTRVTRRVLPGLAGQVGKVALGCRNHVCRFDNLTVDGLVGQRPERKPN
ncbi:MAG: serine/threonine-protein kinase [Archangium sp.]|nr:serine/threonine-protein kinase [Archangium sp.]